MIFQDFQAWKLHTWQDYTYFFLMLGSFLALFYFISRAIIKRRNDVSAQKRVRRKLKLKATEGKVYHGVTFNFDGQQFDFDHLLVDAVGLVAVRTIGWGIRVYGAAEEATWKAEDNKIKDVRIENPIRALEERFEPLRRALAKANIYGVSMEPLAVFADPFAPPELYLGRDSGCITFQQLGSWLKQRKMRAGGRADKLDVAEIIAYLDRAVVPKQAE